MPTDRRYERDDHRYVSEAQWVKQIVQAVAAYRQAGEKLAQYEKPNRSVDELKNGVPFDKRGCHQENDRQNIEQQKPVSEPDGTSALSLVQLP